MRSHVEVLAYCSIKVDFQKNFLKNREKMRKKPLVTGNRLTGFETPDAVILEVSTSDTASVPIILKVDDVEVGLVEVQNHDDDYDKIHESPEQIDSDDSNSGGDQKINAKPSSPSSKKNHNEVEKNRRAKLRGCFERLREVVPVGPDVQKHTTQGLLIRAKNFIKTLERRQNRYATFRSQLAEEQRYLRRRLDQLQHTSNSGSSCNTTSLTITPSSIIPISQLHSTSNQTMNPTTSTTPHILKRRQNPDLTVANSSQPTLNASFVCCDSGVASQSIGSDEMELMGAVEGSSNIHAASLENDQSHPASFDPGLSHRVEFVDV